MLAVARRTVGVALAAVRRLTFEPDPVLSLGRTGRWRWPWLLGGLVLTAAVFSLLAIVAGGFEDRATARGWVRADITQSVFPIDPSQPATFVLLILTSLPFLLASIPAVVLVHGQSWRRLLSWGVGFQWQQFFRTASALLLLGILAAIAGYVFEPGQYQFPARGLSFLPWAVLAIAVVFIQSFGEEVLFRGYLVRWVGAAIPFRIPVTAAVIAVFVAGHVGNEDLRRDVTLNVLYFVAVEIVSYALLFRTRNLAASAGLHWMNNVMALFAPSLPGQPTDFGLMVYTDPIYAAGGSRLLDAFTHVAGILGLVLLLTLLFWRRSPFYIDRAPMPPDASEPATVRTAGEPGAGMAEVR
jgi:membrane protease YdiL (CAAX protease family)